MKMRGFTLIEMLVVVAIILVLSSVGIFSYNEASKKSRDTDRQSDLRTLQTAIGLYKQKNGRYPAGCNGPNTWSGQIGTTYACTGGSGQYITNLAPAFIRFLPQDKRLNGTDSGYVYMTDTNGTVYKLMARKTVESEIVTYGHSLKSCAVSDSGPVTCSNATEPLDPTCRPDCDVAMCDRVNTNSCNKARDCDSSDPVFQTSYGTWGGYSNNSSPAYMARETESVVCKM